MNITTNFLAILPVEYYQKGNRQTALPENNLLTDNINEQGITLNISATSRDKLLQEQNKIAEKTLQANNRQSAATVNNDDNNVDDPLDNIIEQLQQQIDEIKDKLQQIKYDDSESADNRRNEYNAQLISLNGALLNIIGKKLISLDAP